MMRSSGFATFQTSFTASSQTCGSSPRSPAERTAGEVPLGPAGHGAHVAAEMGPRLEVAALAALPAAPLVAGSNADAAAVRDEGLLRRGLRQDHRPALLGALAEEAAEL